MTEIDLNEKRETEEDSEVESKNEQEKMDTPKPEQDVPSNESEAPKTETEADDSEAKVAADVTEKEKKVKTSHKVKDRIMSSFRSGRILNLI